MKKTRKLFGTAVSAVLLLIFSVTILPFDYFHSHGPVQVCASTDAPGQSCQHKLHITKKASICLICGVHHDSAFLLPQTAPVPSCTEGKTTVLTRLFSGIAPATQTVSLRGPPVG